MVRKINNFINKSITHFVENIKSEIDCNKFRSNYANLKRDIIKILIDLLFFGIRKRTKFCLFIHRKEYHFIHITRQQLLQSSLRTLKRLIVHQFFHFLLIHTLTQMQYSLIKIIEHIYLMMVILHIFIKSQMKKYVHQIFHDGYILIGMLHHFFIQ